MSKTGQGMSAAAEAYVATRAVEAPPARRATAAMTAAAPEIPPK
jgi:hypothetical protein